MSDNEISVYHNKGRVFAENHGYFPQLLEDGFHEMMDYFLMNCRSTQKENIEKTASIKGEIERFKDELINKENELISLDNKLNILIDEKKNLQEKMINAEQNLKLELDAKNLEKDNIEKKHAEEVARLGEKRTGSLYEYFLKVIFFMITIGVFMFYWAAWYNGFFIDTSSDIIKEVSDKNSSILPSIVNPYFISEAISGQNYYGLILTIFFTAFPMGVSYIFHRGLHDMSMDRGVNFIKLSFKKYKYVITALFISVLLDVFLGFKIVSEVLKLRAFTSDDIYKSYNVFFDISFYLIMIVCFMGYFVWGYFFMKILHLNDTNYELKRILLAHSSSVDEVLNKNKKVIDPLKAHISEVDEQTNNMKRSIETVKSECRIIKERIAQLTQTIESINQKIVINKTEFISAITQFFLGFVYACNNELSKVDLKIFKDELDKYTNKKELFIKSILEDERYGVI